METDEWDSLTKEEKTKQLFRNQKELLGSFLERGAISRRQYEKSLGDLITKMGITEEKLE